MLVAACVQLLPVKLVQNVKTRSSPRLREEFLHLGIKLSGRHLLARGYFWAAEGVANERTVPEDIESQKWDEDLEGVRITTPEPASAGQLPAAFAATLTLS